METIYGAERNDGKTIFVFGSNAAGRHGKGAALVARYDWGAVGGVGHGRTGQAYAIPTKDSRLQTMPTARIRPYVSRFLRYAAEHPELTFLVTRIGCGLAGYKDINIAPMFKPLGGDTPVNVVLPKEWSDLIDGTSDDSNWVWDTTAGEGIS